MITLVLGGARSGKSAVAEGLMTDALPPVTYVATAMVDEADDADFAARVAAHRRRRPSSWHTVEAGEDLPAVVAALDGTLLIDSLGAWVARREGFLADADGLCAALTGRAGRTVVVSEEVGLGVHPSTAAGRRFRDALGEVNQRVAAVADDVLLVVAGRAMRLEPVARP